MPELPEVETSRRGIEPHLVGATILHAVVRNGRLRWPVSEEIYRLSDQPVLSVQRRAKYLLLELPEGWIIIHLGMSGSLRILPEELPPEKHDHVDLVMSNGKVLRYTDPRRFGAWLWTKELEGHNVLAHLGPEPLSDDFNVSRRNCRFTDEKVSRVGCAVRRLWRLNMRSGQRFIVGSARSNSYAPDGIPSGINATLTSPPAPDGHSPAGNG